MLRFCTVLLLTTSISRKKHLFKCFKCLLYFQAEERLAMIEEQMRFEQEKQKLKKREEKRAKEEQKKILGKGNARPKLSFSLGS